MFWFEPNPLIIAYTLITVVLWVLAGRVATSGSQVQTPLMAVMAGMGLWLVAALAFAGLNGMGLRTSWFIFLALMFVGILLSRRYVHDLIKNEHFWTTLVLGLVTVAPIIWWQSADIVQNQTELRTVFPVLQQWLATNQIGPLLHDPNLNLGTHSIGYALITLPLFFFDLEITPAAITVLNYVLLVLVAGGIAQAASMQVKWSNWPWVVAGSMAGVTILNPFFSLDLLNQASPVWLASIALFAAVAPLFWHQQLPRGWQFLPAALAAIVVLNCAAASWPLVAVVGLIWLVRALLNERTNPDSWLAWVSFVLISAMGWGVGQLLVQQNSLAESMPHFAALTLIDFVFSQPIGVLWMLVVWLWALRLIWQFKGKPNVWLTNQATVILPAVLSVAAVVLCALHLLPVQMLILLQFTLLVPLWRLFQKFYRGSALQKLAFGRPWSLGFGLIAILLVGQWLLKDNLQAIPTPATEHVRLVGQGLRFGEPSRIAVIDQAGYAPLLNEMVAPIHKVGDFTPLLKQIGDRSGVLHAILHQQGYTHLWIHAPNDEVQDLLDKRLSPNQSYLFEVRPNDLRLTAQWPHLNYQQPEKL